ncbi:MAG TPA: helix-turn-helix transcriptional regulator [Steroidobacteraceae bacterium]|nr:helix-turn-helix transcriptional regulator [Steroidobacteraceae bacterium]
MLTPRQTEILALVAAGYRNREVAAVLEIEEETVKSHMRKALERLGARNRAHAVALWLKSEAAP